MTSCRAQACRAVPHQGRVDAYIAAQVKAGIIADSSYIWWAIRPSLAHPTLELRAPDCCTLIDDAIAIAALYRTLVAPPLLQSLAQHA